jgi:hypothetical protein
MPCTTLPTILKRRKQNQIVFIVSKKGGNYLSSLGRYVFGSFLVVGSFFV